MSAGGEKTTVLLVDDADDTRSVLQLFLEHDPVGFDVVGSIAGADEAVEAVRTEAPDVVVLDLQLAGVSGLEVAAEVLRADPAQPIVLFSAFLHPAVAAEAERLGIRACVEKADVSRLPGVLVANARRGRTPTA